MINVKEFVSNLPQLKEDKIKFMMDLILKDSVSTREFYNLAKKTVHGKALIYRSFSFDDWESIYVVAKLDEKKSILEMMLQTANSFENCEYFILENVAMDESFRNSVIEKMAVFAESFYELTAVLSLDEGHLFYDECGALNKKGRDIMRKAINKAFYLKDFDLITNLCSSKNEDLLQEIFGKRAELYPDEFKLD